MNRGIWLGAGAYFTWGLFPIYWRWLQAVPAPQLLGHRIVWSFVMMAAILTALREWRHFRAQAWHGRVLAVYLLAAGLIGVNWLTYVWAVNAGFIVETSLGYFINPLISITLGVVLLREKLRPWQWAPVILATAGVVYLTVTYGAPPWIALTLAFSFGLYGLVKKLAPLNAAHGLTLETGWLIVPALGYLLWAEVTGQGAFGHTDPVTSALLVGAGVVTTVPLLLFAGAAHRIPLSWMGFLQYIAPTLQFMLGVLVYGEPFGWRQLIGFGLVWLALAVLAVENVLAQRKAAVTAQAR